MKPILQTLACILIFTINFGLVANAQTTKTVGGLSGDYPTLKSAFDAINSGVLSGTIVFEIIENTTETVSAQLNASGSGSASYSSITIKPIVSGLKIEGNVNSPLLLLDGADNIVIDGRVNGLGTAVDLEISNSSTGTGASTVKLYHSAENNIIKYCNIKGSETSGLTSVGTGILYLYNSTSGNGNDGNIIEYNNITCSSTGRPTHAIYSYGASSHNNSNNIIRYNSIYNVLNPNFASTMLELNSYSSDFTIQGNSFFETETMEPTGNHAFEIIKINTSSGGNFVISSNYFGGQSQNCGSGNFSKSNVSNNQFCAINITSSQSISSAINGNLISNFNWQNNGNASWTAIQIVSGLVEIGTTSGNTIGAATGTSSIQLTGGASNSNFYGINYGGNANVNLSNNTIGSITTNNSNSAYSTNITCINRTNTKTSLISNNLIGSQTTANSIQAISNSSSAAQSIICINNTSGGTKNISNNIIANISNQTTCTDVSVKGQVIGINSTYGILTLTQNQIRNLSCYNSNNSNSHESSVIGISTTSTNALTTMEGNEIFELTNNSDGFAGSIIGLYFGATGMYTGTSHKVYGNFVRDLYPSGTNSSNTNVYGIKIQTGQTTYYNNVISLNSDLVATYYGIFENGSSSNNNSLYFNTIYIGGAPESGTSNSYALFSNSTANTRIFTNNIFQNSRSNNGASGKHYALYFNYGVSSGLTLNYNDYFVNGSGGFLGYYASNDKTSLPIVSNLDARSISIDPILSDVNGLEATDFEAFSPKLEGVALSSVLVDFGGQARLETPTQGAFEGALSLNLDVYVSGVYKSTYSTLKDAFDKINSGKHKGEIEIKVKANTVETSTASLRNSGYTSQQNTSSYSSIAIYPTTEGLTISGNFGGSIIELYGADYVTIDGRVNRTGSTPSLTITNPATASYSSAIKFTNSATYNNIKYCTLSSSCATSGIGIVYFASSASGNGNDYNTVEYCNITNAGSRQVQAIFSSGSSGKLNNYNTIRYNNIFNFFNPNSTSYGISLNYNTSNWTINNNSFYETTSLSPSGAFKYYPIHLNTGIHTVTGNYIGGNAPNCAGIMNVGASVPSYLCCIYANGETSQSTVIQQNIIRNINYTSTEDNPWDGIFINSGNVDVFDNFIGDSTGTNSIVISTPVPSAIATISGGHVNTITVINGGSGYTSPPIVSFSTSGSSSQATATAVLSGGVVTSITINSGGTSYDAAPNVIFDAQSTQYSTSHCILNASPNTVRITGNVIGSFTTIGSNGYSHGIESFYNRNTSTTLTFSENLIGSRTTPNSIHASSTATQSLQKQDLYGIYCSGTRQNLINNNIVANITNACNNANSGSRTRPISTTYGTNTITNNTIRDINTATTQNSSLSSAAALVGISNSSTQSSTTQKVDGNTIYNLFSTNTSERVDVYGIYIYCPTSVSSSVSKNFIHDINSSSINIATRLAGITLFNGKNLVSNNIICIGDQTSTGFEMNGIFDNGGASNRNEIYYNSILISGNVSSGTTSSTYGLRSYANTSTRNYRNNILMNDRTGGITGKHYSIYMAGMSNTTLNYNNYYSTSGSLGRLASTDKSDLTSWKAATNQDANSISVDPEYEDPNGILATDYYTLISMLGQAISTVTTDYDGLSRPSSPKLGALEQNNYVWTGFTNMDFATASNWAAGTVPLDGSNFSFASSPSNHCQLDCDRSFKNITNTQASKHLIVNGKKLQISGDILFSNNAKIDATQASSSIVFNGAEEQIIPSGIFVDNQIDSLEINNPDGVMLYDDIEIFSCLKLTNGKFNLGNNTVTLDGTLQTLDGTLNGSDSTSLIIQGNADTIFLPEISIRNISINRAKGVKLNGNLTINNKIDLVDGQLNANNWNINFSGDSILRTSGSISVVDTGSTILFDNQNEISLPLNLFSGALNNLTISGEGGLTCPNDISLNGILNLNNDNPTSSKGLLDMWDGVSMKTLTMESQSTTLGQGDVSGIIKRNSFVSNIAYTFGNQFTTVTFPNTGTLPSSWSIKVSLGVPPSWKTDATERVYELIRTGGSGSLPTVKLHYLTTELNGITESDLVFFGHQISTSSTNEYGRINADELENWISLSGNIGFAPTNFGEREWTLASREQPIYTWQGTVPGLEHSWNENMNWVGGSVPDTSSEVIIPTGCSNYPLLPDSVSIYSINIQAGAILTSDSSSVLIINGANSAWQNLGTFEPSTGKIIFTNSSATISGSNIFHNLQIPNDGQLTLTTGVDLKINGLFENDGILDATTFPNTINYCGDNQIVLSPNGPTPGYYNLILSGNGIKTLPVSSLVILNDFFMTDSSEAEALADLNILGNMVIDTNAIFSSGNFNHNCGGDLFNHGTCNISNNNTFTMNGTQSQTIGGSSIIDFNNLIINNSSDVFLVNDESETNVLTLSNGSLVIGNTTFSINGTIVKSNGYLDVGINSSISFGGSASYSIPDNLFETVPSLHNLIINRSGGIELGNQDIIVNGALILLDGSLDLAGNSLHIAGDTIIIVDGNLICSNTNSILEFANDSLIIIPENLFSTAISNMTISGTGGVVSLSDLSINGILNLQSANPSSVRGLLDMDNGVSIATLSMGANATITGSGDVTGFIKRTYFEPGIDYTFGNQNTKIIFSSIGTLPSELTVKIAIGSAASWASNSILRTYEFVQIGGSGCLATVSTHYLDSELNGNMEEDLVQWTFGHDGGMPSGTYEWGKSNNNTSSNWVEIANVSIGNFPTSFGKLENSLMGSNNLTYTWNGSFDTDWDNPSNWTPSGSPSSSSNIIIPDYTTTSFSPTLPSNAEIQSITLQSNSVLNSSELAQLEINGSNGAWNNEGGVFNQSTSSILFKQNNATISGSTTFHNISIENSKTLSMSNGCEVKIDGAILNSGTLFTNISGPTNVEYGGSDQSIALPGSSNNYYNLTIRGTGNKTLPNQTFNVLGDFNLSGSTTAFANSNIVIEGDLNILQSSTFSSGNYTHRLKGDLNIEGNYSAGSSNTLIFEGDSVQSVAIDNPISLVNLTMENPDGITSNNDFLISGILTLNSGLINLSSNMIVIESGATATGASVTSYVNGQCRKIGNTPFTFPVGKDSIFAPVSISAPSLVTDHFTAEYFPADPNDLFDVSLIDETLDHVSRCEYWIVNRTNGSSNVSVNLTWDARSCGVTNLNEMRVVRWDGSHWRDHGNIYTGGTENSGNITSGLVTSFSPFTLGSVSEDNPLPINLINFSGTCNEEFIKLIWSTASEYNNHYFEILKSTDNENWYLIASIPGHGFTNNLSIYSFTDSVQSISGNYYKLRQIDFNGLSQDYNSIFIESCLNQNFSIKTFPQPITDELNISFDLIISDGIVEIINQSGVSVFYFPISNSSSIKINTSDWNPGVYIAKIRISNSVLVSKFVKI